jgi:Fe2+ transport system protein FeoA
VFKSLFRRRKQNDSANAPALAADQCPLGACATGQRATVVCVACPAHDARRLRTLGVFEGAELAVIGKRSGILLDVRGSRLALDTAIAMAVTVRPVGP